MFFLSACSQVESINLKVHKFKGRPDKIIWIQVAGLNEGHLPFLKFDYEKINDLTPFENATCTGSLWNYNLYKLRPSAKESFLSQVIGSKNIKNSCEDYKQKTIWNYLTKAEYSVGLFDKDFDNKNGIEQAISCGQKDFLKDVIYWKMVNLGANVKKEINAQYFHHLRPIEYEKGKIYLDKSCVEKDCFASFFESVKHTFKYLDEQSSHYIYIVRNFDFRNAIIEKDVKKFKQQLVQLARVYSYFHDFAKKTGTALLLLTSAESMPIEMPLAGKEWGEYLQEGKHVTFKNQSLISSLWAYGARAENFCGMGQDSELLIRLLLSPDDSDWWNDLVKDYNSSI